MNKTVTRLFAAFALTAGAAANVVNLTWEQLPALPPSAGQAKQPGVAGPFAGVHGDALIVAGGANFPDRLPWDGGAKIWWDDIWVLEHLADANPRWVADKTFHLPRRVGYGTSVDTPEGVICAGGHDAERCYADVFLLSWDAQTRAIQRTELPAMPEPLSFMAGALVGSTFYVAGGQATMKSARPSNIFWALDLSKRGRPADFTWQVLPSWPGPARVLPVAAAQRGPNGMEFYLFSGRMPEAGKPTKILADAYAYNPAKREWRTLPPVGVNSGAPKGKSVMAGAAAAAGEREILILGGDRGELFLELEAHDIAAAGARAKRADASTERKAELEREVESRLAAKRKIYDAHPGFAREVLAYDTLKNTWRVVGDTPFAPQVTTLAVKHGETILIPSGEIKPGIRTREVVRVTVESK